MLFPFRELWAYQRASLNVRGGNARNCLEGDKAMRRFLVMMASVLGTSASSASTQKFKVGATARVKEGEWVTIENLVPVENGNYSFSRGKYARIQPGGTVRVVGIEGD